jgi:deaminated glutathione amidase
VIETMRAAVVQLNSTDDKDRNLEAAERLVRAAAADGAELIVLPEKWSLLASGDVLADGAEYLDGPALTAAGEWARELGVFLVAGSIAEYVERQEKVYNASSLIDRDGEIVATYRKIHMFDAQVEGVAYSESEHEEAGYEAMIGPVGDAGVGLGLTICYDLRFPALYETLVFEGARIIAVPSAFTAPTGRAHWEPLLRARAIEDQVFVLAANQVGTAPPHYDSWGHSMIVDPWGVVLAQAPAQECFVAADLDFGEQDKIREKLPVLTHRRPYAYRVYEEADI